MKLKWLMNRNNIFKMYILLILCVGVALLVTSRLHTDKYTSSYRAESQPEETRSTKEIVAPKNLPVAEDVDKRPAIYLDVALNSDDRSQIKADDTSNWNVESKRKKSKRYIKLSKSEINILASLVFFEGGAESIESQRAIASVVINRMKLDGLSLRQVVFAKNQFEPAHLIGNKSISSKYMERAKEVVNYVCKHGPTVPKYVTYFRADYYHNWSGMHAYKKIDQTYFSYDEACYDRYIKQKK